jgi:pimeloyl-ACP methyl ester carboxylesterase
MPGLSFGIVPHPLRFWHAPWRHLSIVAWAVLLVAGLNGCAEIDPLAHAEALAAPAKMKRELVQTDGTDGFVLTAFVRITRPDAPLRFYIEGDGRAWMTRTQPSLDPTPHVALGLELATEDPAPNVIYLARACQFTPMEMNPRCAPAWWTGKRFAPEIVASMNQAIGHFAQRVPGAPIELVGYSGGAALAVLVAARRSDVVSIRTVAGNLDDEYINRLHDVSSMPKSANPIDFARAIARIPQVHFSGEHDRVVPPQVAQRFVKAAGLRCARALPVPGADHEAGWTARWPALLLVAPACTATSTP